MPCEELAFPRFMATFIPSSNSPMYTLPNPPTPITSFSSKFLVASFSSLKVKNRPRLGPETKMLE
ncbi:hypothetical protein LguiA_009620 [Lonicera macranthoides]